MTLARAQIENEKGVSGGRALLGERPVFAYNHVIDIVVLEGRVWSSAGSQALNPRRKWGWPKPDSGVGRVGNDYWVGWGTLSRDARDCDMKLGAHVSSAGGLDKSIDRAQEMGAETIQIFASSPRAWAFKPVPEDRVIAFREKAESAAISPTFLHGSYLVNMGGALDLVRKSIDSLSDHMNVAGQIGAAGVIFHSGSHRGSGFDAVLGQAAAALKEVLSRSPSDVWLIIENCAGMGDQIGASFQEIGRLMNAIASPQVMVCLDTEHCFAAGYDITDPDGANAVMDEFDREIGISKLVAVHANDSKVALGAGVDRHENIGEGHMGLKGFEVIMGHPVFRDVPFILEVPGADKKGPDKENLDRLKEIRRRLNVPV